MYREPPTNSCETVDNRWYYDVRSHVYFRTPVVYDYTAANLQSGNEISCSNPDTYFQGSTNLCYLSCFVVITYFSSRPDVPADESIER
ncbi:hypothetical protein QTP88_002314 [Uroleucon formosanum]